MLLREEIEQREFELLAPYATKAKDSRGRKYPESEHPYRSAFQRDKDRVIFSAAFRRLQYKTQVFSNFEGDYYRTRLTHTLEVSHIARSIARGLRLNEDLSEAIALAHDLGHTPFGHIGERILNDLMGDYGGFEHNRQSLRVVEELEDTYPEFHGLNLSWETREGLKKHEADESKFHYEAQLVDKADEIAYCSHDLDDGLRAGLLSGEAMSELGLWREIQQEINERYPGLPKFQKVHLTIKWMINEQVTDLVMSAEKHLLQPSDAKDEQKISKVYFSSSMSEHLINIRKYLFDHFYKNKSVVKLIDFAQRCLEGLFLYYLEHPETLPVYYRKRFEQEEKRRVLCDYISGMTDRFAYDEYKRLIEVTA